MENQDAARAPAPSTVPTAAAPSDAPVQLVIRVHGELSQLVQPATPASIRASSIMNNRALFSITILGIVSFLILLLPTLFADSVYGKDEFQMIGAAGLGSAFYSLYTANRYLRDGTFDPRYNQLYLIRFALGVFAGYILGHFGREMLSSVDSNNGNTKQIGTATLALVGGFASEAVAQILQRIADTLVTVVRGSDKDRAEADAEKLASQKTTKAASQLHDALDIADPQSQSTAIRKIIKGMLA